MATTCTINVTSDIAPGFAGINETMTLTQAGTLTDIDSTTGISNKKIISNWCGRFSYYGERASRTKR